LRFHGNGNEKELMGMGMQNVIPAHLYSQLILTLLYHSLNLVINTFSSGLLRGAWFRRKEVESAAAVGLCCTHKAPVRCLLVFRFRKVMLKH